MGKLWLLAIGLCTISTSAMANCPKNARVEVNWNQKWYKARILSGPDHMGNCYITYEGYDKKWDEWAAPGRIRQAAQPMPQQQQTPIRPPGQGIPPQRHAMQPPPPAQYDARGKYQCYNSLNGQMVYAGTDVYIQGQNSYALSNGQGSGYYNRRGNVFSFNGPIGHARGELVNLNGQLQLRLVFNNNMHSAWACAKR